MDSSALAPYFKFYDELVSDWLSNTRYLSEKYLPEPWWGWSDSGKPLYGVVINLNPGDGGILQTRRYIRFGIGSNFSYREAMANGSLARHLEGATRWHKSKREDPILKVLNESSASDLFSANTLCIEIYPFHSKKFDEKSAIKYYDSNRMMRFWHTLAFAAEASKRVQGKLQNVVVLRMSYGMWQRLSKSTGELVPNITSGAETPINDSCIQDFTIHFPREVFHHDDDFHIPSAFEGVTFLCIWGKSCRNNLPSNLKDLLSLYFNNQ